MKKLTLKNVFFLFTFFIISVCAHAQNEPDKKIFYKIFLAGELNYTAVDAAIIDETFSKAMFIYGCKTNIETKIIELHATEGLNKAAIVDFLSYTGKGYKVGRIDQMEE